jgi:hypothetical protein
MGVPNNNVMSFGEISFRIRVPAVFALYLYTELFAFRFTSDLFLLPPKHMEINVTS